MNKLYYLTSILSEDRLVLMVFMFSDDDDDDVCSGIGEQMTVPASHSHSTQIHCGCLDDRCPSSPLLFPTMFPT